MGDAGAVNDARRPSPGQVVGVRVRLGHGTARSAHPLPDGRWSLPVTQLAAGPTTVGVTVERAGAPSVSGTFAWTVGPAGPTPRTLVSRAPVRTPLLGLAVLVALWGLGIAVAQPFRRRGPWKVVADPSAPSTPPLRERSRGRAASPRT